MVRSHGHRSDLSCPASSSGFEREEGHSSRDVGLVGVREQGRSLMTDDVGAVRIHRWWISFRSPGACLRWQVVFPWRSSTPVLLRGGWFLAEAYYWPGARGIGGGEEMWR